MSNDDSSGTETPPHPDDCKIRIGAAWDSGRRGRMEDAHNALPALQGDSRYALMAVYDGHSGKTAAEWVGENMPGLLYNYLLAFPGDTMLAMQKACIECDRLVCGNEEIRSSCGTTACLCLVDFVNGKLTCANVGDSRALVIMKDNQGRRLSNDHNGKDEQEKERIRRMLGGLVRGDRVEGALACARAIGDADIKSSATADPLIVEVDLRDVKGVVIGCDGVWDVVKDQMAVDVVVKELEANKSTMEKCALAANALVKHAYKKGSEDNISVVIGSFL